MRIFLPGIPQDVYHFTDYAQTGNEYQGRFDMAHPGSLLYAKDPDGGYTLVGAMYSAPPEATPGRSRRDRAAEHCKMACAYEHLPSRGSDDRRSSAQRFGADRADEPGDAAGFRRVPNAVELNHRYGFLADGRFGFEGKISDVEGMHRRGRSSG